MDNKAYKSTADHAAEIRAAYKAKGWTGRMISVRTHNYSMGSSIYVTIKDASIPQAEAEQIAKGAERIDRDGYGEILCGGNRFVDVRYDSDVLAAMGARYMPAVEAAAANLKPEGERESYLYPIEGTEGLMIGRASNGFGFSLWNKKGHLSQHGNELDSIARAVAIAMVPPSAPVYSARTTRALAKHGAERCAEAFRLTDGGNGVGYVAACLEIPVNAADAMIDAGREISEKGGR